jgi:hypothetical protein
MDVRTSGQHGDSAGTATSPLWRLATVVVLALVGLAAYVARMWDRMYDVPLPEVHISSDPTVLARGEYLVYGPAHCVECNTGSFDALEKLSEGVQVQLSDRNK